MAEFILTGFSDEIADDFITQLEVIKKLNLSYIEIRNANKKNISDHTIDEVKILKAQLLDYGIKVSAIGSPIGKISIEDDFKPHLEKFKHTLEIARILDTKYIRLFSFYIPENKNPADYQDKVLDQFNKFCEEAKGSGIMLLHENEKGIFGESVYNCKIIMESCDNSVANAVFDPANFVQGKQQTFPYGYKTLKPYIKYLHIKDCKSSDNSIVPSGEGDANIKDIIQTLIKDNYNGFLSLEPHLHSGDISVGGDELFIKAYKALIKILNELKAEYK